MRRAAIALLVATGLLASPAHAQSRDWAFVQSVGGLALGVPVQKDGAWHLPIRCNVSGIEAITIKPTTLNSALACSTVARVEAQTIVLTVVTGLASSGSSAKCPAARLGTSRTGRYAVFYSGSPAERVPLGEVNLAL